MTTTKKPKVLIVEDEVHLAMGIADNLLAEGFAAEVVGDGEAALARWQQGDIDMIVLDVMLPRKDGHRVCLEIRAQGGQLPILFLTAKNGPEERIDGLEAGADDYLGKPFALKELLLRLHAMWRRQCWLASQAPIHSPESFHDFGEIRVDLARHQIHFANGTWDTLPQQELVLLQLLLQHPMETVTREQALQAVFGTGVYPSSRTLEQLFQSLQRKLEVSSKSPRFLHAVPGIGYCYRPR